MTTYQSQGQDNFFKNVEDSLAAVQAEHTKQKEINDKIREGAQNVDPMEIARRMQENLMKDPQNAMKYMQGIGYRSVAEFVAVEDYLKRVGRIFNQRADRPRCTPKRCD